jgi:hypothetical protein
MDESRGVLYQDVYDNFKISENINMLTIKSYRAFRFKNPPKNK